MIGHTLGTQVWSITLTSPWRDRENKLNMKRLMLGTHSANWLTLTQFWSHKTVLTVRQVAAQSDIALHAAFRGAQKLITAQSAASDWADNIWHVRIFGWMTARLQGDSKAERFSGFLFFWLSACKPDRKYHEDTIHMQIDCLNTHQQWFSYLQTALYLTYLRVILETEGMILHHCRKANFMSKPFRLFLPLICSADVWKGWLVPPLYVTCCLLWKTELSENHLETWTMSANWH